MEHLDLDQHYDGNFWTRCACGLEFGGLIPDDADGHQLAHRDSDAEQLAQYPTELQARKWTR